MILCKKCHESLVSEYATESQLISEITKILCDVTCIKWAELTPNAPSPDGCELFGFVDITNYGIGDSTESLIFLKKEVDGTTEKAACVEVSHTVRADINLIIVGRNEAFCVDGVVQEVERPSDKMIELMHLIPQVNSVSPIKLNRFTDVGRDVTRTIDGVMEQTATSTTTAEVCRKIAYADDPILVTCVHSCDGESLCEPEKTCEEI